MSGLVAKSYPSEIDCPPNVLVHPTGVVLGQGAYSDVLEVEYRGEVYAAKKYRLIHSSTLESFTKEHEIHCRTRHPNIVSYYGICKLATDRSTVIVMGRMDMILTTFLNISHSLERKIQVLNDVVKGLHYLHSQEPAIIHRDLTAGNILLDSRGTAKIGDFGNSCMVDLHATPELLTSCPGTLDYMSPEALEGGEYDNRLDMFSFGHLSIHVLIQRRPHPLLRTIYRLGGKLMPRTEVERRKLYLNQVKSSLEGGDSHPLYQLIIKCLHDEPHLRPSCANILTHSPFAQLNSL
jgi:serine/threonine protein kinase